MSRWLPPFKHLFQSIYLLVLGCLLVYAAAAMSLRHGGLSLPFSQWLLVFLLLALLIGAAAYPLARRMTRRLNHVQTSMAAFGRGDLRQRARVEGADEIAAVAQGFNEAAARIETLVGAHRRLLADASHELRTPLARMRLAIDLIEGDIEAGRRIELQRNLAELDELIEEILLASRLESMPAMVVEKIDLVALVAEEVAQYPGVQLELHEAELRSDFKGDSRLLRRMLRNLLENARRHGAPPVRVELQAKDGILCLRCRDAGNGVPPEDLERVFEPFHRGRFTGENRGFGLGLALVKQIAELHGGQVECARGEAPGCEFVVRLPHDKGAAELVA